MRTTITPSLDLVSDIRHTTAKANRNNVTRTAAYLDFYRKHPEIHWALLAHLVSRNGGWNMTDLRGEWLPRLLSAEEAEAFFAFLERCNWLIFHDAYAQLLLYEKMKETSHDLTALLPQLGVSRFMVPIWRDFLHSKNSQRLTWALIINEQQYIHQRVVQQTFYRQTVLDSFAFQAQSVLSLNQVLFPYRQHPADSRVRLVGIAVHNFPSVEQRIEIGKTLYNLLYSNEERFAKIRDWACRIRHTGSRSDYWPHLFSPVKQAPDESKYQERITGAELLPGRPKLYSPRLTSAWRDAVHPPADGTDWFVDEKWSDYLQEGPALPTIDEENYALSLNLVEAGLKLVNTFT
jgi:hypothetical protein